MEREGIIFDFRVYITSIFYLKGVKKNMGKKESEFQRNLIDEIKERFPGSIVIKTDPGFIQGIPDLIILFNNKWAMLECKKNKTAHHQPNQDYYVDLLNKLSFSAFIYPENKESILNGLEKALY